MTTSTFIYSANHGNRRKARFNRRNQIMVVVHHKRRLYKGGFSETGPSTTTHIASNISRLATSIRRLYSTKMSAPAFDPKGMIVRISVHPIVDALELTSCSTETSDHLVS